MPTSEGVTDIVFPLAGAAAGIPSITRPDPMGFGAADNIFSGFVRNLSRQPAQQKKYSFPACSDLKRAVAGSTFIPHTGSTAGVACIAAFMLSILVFSLPRQILLGGMLPLLDTLRVNFGRERLEK